MKPQIKVYGTDSLLDIAGKARKEMEGVYSDEQINNVIRNLFQAKPVSHCTKKMEEYLEVSYIFGQ